MNSNSKPSQVVKSTGVPVVVYRRASHDPRMEASSIKNQFHALDHAVEAHGFTVVGKYGETNVSASKQDVLRKEFERMINDIESGRVSPTLILAIDISRLIRNRKDKLRIEALIVRGVHVLELRHGIDTREKLGMLMFSLAAEMAIERAQELAYYQRISHDRRKAEGRPRPNMELGFGFRCVRGPDGEWLGNEHVPSEAGAIRWASKQLRAGKSMTFVRTAWADPSHPHYAPPRHSDRLHLSAVRHIMISAKIAGCTEVEEYDESGALLGTRLVPNTDGTLPAIISVDELLEIRAVVRQNALRSSVGQGFPSLKNLLSGILLCKSCRNGLAIITTQAGKRRYYCYHCASGASGRGKRQGVSCCADFADAFVAGATFERVRSGAVAAVVERASQVVGLEEVAARLTAEERALDEFLQIEDREEESVSPRAFVAFVRSKEDLIARLRSELSQKLSGASANAALLPSDLDARVEALWDESDLNWRRNLIRACWQEIIVRPESETPGSRRDPSLRFTLVPRVVGS